MTGTQIIFEPAVRSPTTLPVEPMRRIGSNFSIFPGIWVTSGDYANILVGLSGIGPGVTDSVGDLNSPIAAIRRQLSVEHLDETQAQIERLDTMRSAGTGWDGYCAAPPVVATLDRAKDLLLLFADRGLPIPTASVSSTGNAALFRNDSTYLDLEIHENDTISWLVQLPQGPEVEGEEYFDGTRRSLRIVDILKYAPGIDA